MADDVDVEEFLAHHGVMGMHWGYRKSGEPVSPKKLAKMNAHADAGDALIKKHGSADKARLVLVGKSVGAYVGANVLANLIGRVTDSPSVHIGASAVANVGSIAYSIHNIDAETKISAAEERKENS